MSDKGSRRGSDERRYSSAVVDGIAQAPSRAMLRAVGFTEGDFKKSQIGIASTWSMVTPCNMHIDTLAQEAARGADEAGGKAVIFNTSRLEPWRGWIRFTIWLPTGCLPTAL